MELQKQIKDIVQELNLLKEQQALQTGEFLRSTNKEKRLKVSSSPAGRGFLKITFFLLLFHICEFISKQILGKDV